MNIAYVVPEFVTETKGGGLASYINNIAQILAARGHRITVMVKSTVNERIAYQENIVVERISVDLSKADANIPGSYYREWSRMLNHKLKVLHEREHFDVVQYANWTALALYRTDIPTVVRISSDLPYWRAANTLQYDPKKQYFCEKITDYLEELALMQADTVFGPSRLLANIISERTGVSVEVLESPFDRKMIKEDDTVYRDVLQGKTYLLSFGNLNLLKGYKLIGDVIFDVLKAHENLVYVLAGNDHGWSNEFGEHVSAVGYIKEHAREYANRVIYLGALDRELLYPVIRNSLLCVMPSRIDNLPNACIEAMALGKVVIGTRGASFEQLIHNDVNGLLIDREDAEGLKRAVAYAFHMQPEKRWEMGLRAKERVKALSADIVADKTIALYQRTINNRKPQTNSRYYEKVLEKCENF